MTQHAHWFIRIPFAATFLYHGIGKFAALQMTVEMLQMPAFLVILVAIAEILAGIGAIVGGLAVCKKRDLVTRLAGAAVAPVMLGAIFMVHWPRFSFVPTESHPMGGMEFQLLLLGVAVYFLLAGNKEQ